MTAENIKSGFASTGICPVNRTKYPIHRLDTRLLTRYTKWIDGGKKDWQVMATSTTTP